MTPDENTLYHPGGCVCLPSGCQDTCVLMESASLLIAHSPTSVFKHTSKEEREDQLKSAFSGQAKVYRQ